MSSAPLVGLLLVAALACPAMMWFQARRGKSSHCCPPRRDQEDQGTDDLAALKARHSQLSAQLAELESRPEDPAPTSTR